MKENPQNQIVVSVYWYKDDDGVIHYDFDEIVRDFEEKLSELDGDVKVRCEVSFEQK